MCLKIPELAYKNSLKFFPPRGRGAQQVSHLLYSVPVCKDCQHPLAGHSQQRLMEEEENGTGLDTR